MPRERNAMNSKNSAVVNYSLDSRRILSLGARIGPMCFNCSSTVFTIRGNQSTFLNEFDTPYMATRRAAKSISAILATSMYSRGDGKTNAGDAEEGAWYWDL